ncbi:MAG: bifunctional 3-(3-hydroxy-phenyl)propionate/3-hydroxycinnamic acid hydroxylase [Actinomycetota bacterium]
MTGQSSVEAHDADLIVVGCGPVGVMAALRARQHGLSVIAVDRATDVYPLPRAIGMDDEIQRLFATAGLLDGLRACSTPMAGAEFLDADGRRVVGIELPEGFLGPNGHPPVVAFDQPSLERLLRTAAIAAGAELRLGVEVTALAGTTLTLGDGSTLTGRWLIGADGAKSTIRRLLGVVLEDQGFDEEWVVVDTTLQDPALSLSRLATQHCDPARVVTYVPGHADRRRWEFQFLPGETKEEMESPTHIAELLSPWGTADQLRIDRIAVYRFHATVADAFRVGDVFLAGDAAHQMPPFNGQGMCTGMRDVDNLVWKLGCVAADRADDRLLDTYETERKPHAAGQVAHAVDAGRLINAIAEGRADDVEAGYGGGRPFPHLEAGCQVAGHHLVGRPFPQPVDDAGGFDRHLGDRFALVTTADTVLDPVVVDRWTGAGARRVDTDPSTFPGLVETGTTVVVRPDRSIAAVTTDLGAATDALAALGLLAT